MIFSEMQQVTSNTNHFTFASIFHACATLHALEQGKKTHTHLTKTGCVLDVYAGSALIDMYVKCRSIEDVWKVFDEMSDRNEVSLNPLIVVYVQLG